MLATAVERALLGMLAHVAARLVDGARAPRARPGPSRVIRERVRAGRRPAHLDDGPGRRGFDVDGDSPKSVGAGLTDDLDTGSRPYVTLYAMAA